MDTTVSPDAPVTPLAAKPLFARSETNGRDNNEDSFLVFALALCADAPPLQALAVSDGMGGHAFGEQVSFETLRRLAATLFEELCIQPALNSASPAPMPTPESLGESLRRAAQQANAHILRMITTNKWDKAGATLVVALLLPGQAVVLNVGDSPLYHFEARTGQLRRMTDDHSVAGILLKAGMISPEMARVHEGKSRLEYHIGRKDLPEEMPVAIFSVTPGDILLLCSDGISGPLKEEFLTSTLASDTPLEAMAERLIAESCAQGETDNQTVVLWRCPPSGMETISAQAASSPAAAPAKTVLISPDRLPQVSGPNGGTSVEVPSTPIETASPAEVAEPPADRHSPDAAPTMAPVSPLEEEDEPTRPGLLARLFGLGGHEERKGR